VPPSVNVDAAFIASISLDVNIEDDEEPYGTARAVDSDDDRPVAPLSEQEMELIRHFRLDRDPLVHEFSDLSHSQNAYVEGRDDELGLSQLPDAPSTQPPQVARRRRRSPSRYTPGTDALGHKGKGKTRRQ